MISARQLGDGVHRNPSVPRNLFVAGEIESRRTIAFHQELDHVVFPCCADVHCILLRQDNILFSLDLAAMSALVTLSSGRICLRRWRDEDREEFAAMNSDARHGILPQSPQPS